VVGRLVDLIRWRPRKTPLITVSNHCSSLDEPLLFSALIPWPILQWQLRYSLCNDNMSASLTRAKDVLGFSRLLECRGCQIDWRGGWL